MHKTNRPSQPQGNPHFRSLCERLHNNLRHDTGGGDVRWWHIALLLIVSFWIGAICQAIKAERTVHVLFAFPKPAISVINNPASVSGADK